MDATEASHDYERVAAAIRFLRDHHLDQPALAEVAGHLGLSPAHLQRVFQRWAGISPKRFLQSLTVEHARRLLDAAAPVLEASLASGLSGPGRLHDHFVSLIAVSPGEYREAGAGLEIRFGFHDSPFGRVALALTDRGVCGLTFAESGREEEALSDARACWHRARWVKDDAAVATVMRTIFVPESRQKPLALLVRGTNFQYQVWNALLRIPAGRVTTYSEVAQAAGNPRAVRAAASAVGDNPVAWLIPCHRVIRKTGELGGYRWGLERKAAMLAWESTVQGNPAD